MVFYLLDIVYYDVFLYCAYSCFSISLGLIGINHRRSIVINTKQSHNNIASHFAQVNSDAVITAICDYIESLGYKVKTTTRLVPLHSTDNKSVMCALSVDSGVISYSGESSKLSITRLQMLETGPTVSSLSYNL